MNASSLSALLPCRLVVVDDGDVLAGPAGRQLVDSDRLEPLERVALW
jgi:hypothetical protein